MGFPLYWHGTRCLRQSARAGTRSMPCLLVTVGSPARITGYPPGPTQVQVEAFVPRRGSADSFSPGQRVAFQAVAVARLSSTRTRCSCYRRVFVPRDDYVLRCVKYTFVVQGCQAKMVSGITKRSLFVKNASNWAFRRAKRVDNEGRIWYNLAIQTQSSGTII